MFPVTEAHGSHPLVHICWNESGSELAVVDSSGRVSIYSISIALNSIAGQRQAAFDPDDEINQVVGMMWLSTQRSVCYFPHFDDHVLKILGPRIPPSGQSKWSLGLFSLSTSPNWSFSSGK